MMPRVSVVMPCFNAAASVGRAVRSVLGQTLDDWELVVVDDGSDDGSAEAAEAAADGDERVRVWRRDHEGVVGASNFGFGRARGELIARMDADDVSLPERLEKQVGLLDAAGDLGAVSCLTRFAGNEVEAGGYAHHVAWTNEAASAEEIALRRFVDLPVPHPTLMYRRELVERFGGYRDGGFPEDYEMVLRWLDGGVRIGRVAEVLYDWHDPPGRLSRTDERYAMMAFHETKAPYLARAIEAAGCGDRELWICGAGRPARKCARPLEAAWKPASGFIDADPAKVGRVIHGRVVVSAEDLPTAERAVIVSYVGTRGAGGRIRAQLCAAGRVEGVDFWLAA
ncbi:MAG: glycosyltransferase family 2 protein [Verrucomicrobiota bacterium JB025]|nr:glycosyltransferase [Verrucomicrobiota bacterium JB025]